MSSAIELTPPPATRDRAAPGISMPRTDDTGARVFGMLVLLLAVGGFTSWSLTVPIDSAAVAPGIVTIESSRKTVQHRDGGIIAEILVREGDRVEVGDVLVRLDATDARAQLEMARSRFFGLRAQEQRLMAERDGLDHITFADDLLAFEEGTRAEEAIVGQRRLFHARREALIGEKEVLQQRITQLGEQIQGYEASMESSRRRISLYQQEIDALNKLFDKGFSDSSRLREFERLVAELEGEISEQQAAIGSAKVQIGETRLQIVQLSRQFASDVAEELQRVQSELAELRERIFALEKTVQLTEIRAPTSGQVVGLTVHTVGGVVASGEPILDIVPEGESLIIEARVAPTDIDRVSPGLEAELRLTAFNAAETPTVPGTVLTVSGDRLTEPQTQTSYYLARIRVSPEGMATLGRRTLLPGMPADVLIKTGERTFFEYLLRPLTDRMATAIKED